MSASQVRFLSLQSRKSRIGRDLNTLSNRKMALSRDMDKVARNFTNALNNINLKWSNNNGDSYQNLDYEMLMRPNQYNWETPYIITDKDGKVVVDNANNLIGITGFTSDGTAQYGELTGKRISQGPCAGKALTYENIAEWITKTRGFDGSIGQVTVDSAGQKNGTANPSAYVIPEGIEEFGYDNALRFKIFQELGLVDSGSAAQYNAFLKELYGSEAACSFGDYSALLQSFVDNGFSNLSDIGGIHVSGSEGAYSTYFSGCLYGKLALAESALTEYDRWCNELKQFNLGSDTNLTFTALSGVSKTFTVPAFLSFNQNAGGIPLVNVDELEFISSEGLNGNQKDVLKGSYNNSGSAYAVAYDTFDEVYNNNGWVDLGADGTPLDTILKFLTMMDASFGQNSVYHDTENGTTWQFFADSTLTDQYVTLTDSDHVVTSDSDKHYATEAAKRYALEQTIKFYKKTFAEDKTYELEIASSYGGDEDVKVTRFAEQMGSNSTPGGGIIEEYNGVLSERREYSYAWEGITGGTRSDFNQDAVEATEKFTESLVDDIFGVLTLTDLGPDLSKEVTAAVYNKNNKGYSFNLANVEKSYFTFYEMYMQAFQNYGVNLLDGDSAAENVQYKSYVDNSVMARLNELSQIGNNVNTITHLDNPISMEDAVCFETLYDTNVNYHTNSTHFDSHGAHIIYSHVDPSAFPETYLDNSTSPATLYDHKTTFTNVEYSSVVDKMYADGIQITQSGSSYRFVLTGQNCTDNITWTSSHTTTLSDTDDTKYDCVYNGLHKYATESDGVTRNDDGKVIIVVPETVTITDEDDNVTTETVNRTYTEVSATPHYTYTDTVYDGFTSPSPIGGSTLTNPIKVSKSDLAAHGASVSGGVCSIPDTYTHTVNETYYSDSVTGPYTFTDHNGNSFVKNPSVTYDFVAKVPPLLIERVADATSFPHTGLYTHTDGRTYIDYSDHTCVEYSGLLRTVTDDGFTIEETSEGSGIYHYMGAFNDGTTTSTVEWILVPKTAEDGVTIMTDASGRTMYDHCYTDPATGNTYYKSTGGYYIAREVVHERTGELEDRKWQLPPIIFDTNDGSTTHNEIIYQLDETSHDGAFMFSCTDTTYPPAECVAYMNLAHYSQTDSEGYHLWGFYAFDFEGDEKKDYKLYRSQYLNYSCIDSLSPDEFARDPFSQELESTYERYKFTNIDIYENKYPNDPTYTPTVVDNMSGFFIEEVSCDDVTGEIISKTRTYFFEKFLTHTDHGNDMDIDATGDNVEYVFNIVKEIANAEGVVSGYEYKKSDALLSLADFYNNGYKVYKSCFDNGVDAQPKTTQTFTDTSYSNPYTGASYSVAVDGSKFATQVSAFITPSEEFRLQLKDEIDKVYEEIHAYENRLSNFFSEKQRKLMDYYDALFTRIAENGWVCDTNINKKGSAHAVEQARSYVNNKLQNNDYFITECLSKDVGVGYKFTSKQATGIQKIFQVHDNEAETEAYATYECEKKRISDKESAIDERMAELETEQEVIETELESLKKIRNKNIDRYFKIFG